MTTETIASFENLHRKLQRMRDDCLWGKQVKFLKGCKFTDQEREKAYRRLVDQANMCVLMQDLIQQHVDDQGVELYFPD